MYDQTLFHMLNQQLSCAVLYWAYVPPDWNGTVINVLAGKHPFGAMTVLTVCSGQSRDIQCDHPSFLYVLDAFVGYDENITTEYCSFTVTDSCVYTVDDFLSFTTEKSIMDIRVPQRNIKCTNNHEQSVNFIQIHYTCVQGRWGGVSLYSFDCPLLC